MDPSKSLAVALDVGTDNEDLLNDPLYIVSACALPVRCPTDPLPSQGWRHKRLRGKQYDDFIDKWGFPCMHVGGVLTWRRFVQLVRKHHPHCLLHFEDFGVSNAQRLLSLYRDKHAVFNDDM
jgi:malate dehydrogenase (oxaloacetate-decarboxylating)